MKDSRRRKRKLFSLVDHGASNPVVDKMGLALAILCSRDIINAILGWLLLSLAGGAYGEGS